MHELGNRAKREQVKAECKQRGIAINRPSPHCWHLIGPGVDLLVSDLAFIDPMNLQPYCPRK